MQKILKQNFSVFGRTTLRKFSKLKIYIQGLSKIGAELVTNLIILSPQLITVYDNEMIKLEDCYNTFHYPKQFVQRKSRADYIIQLAHRLSKVYIEKTNTQLSEENVLKYDIIIFCDIYDLGRAIAIDNFIRRNRQSKTVVMYACQMGYFGFLITDFGKQWQMYHSGLDLPLIPIEHITNSQKGEVTTKVAHNYQTGDFITINYVEGMKYVNGDARPIQVINDRKFVIEDTKNFGTYLKGGGCQKVEMGQKLHFISLQEQIFKDRTQIMLFAKAIICYYQNNSRLPQLFKQFHQQQTMQNLELLAKKSGQTYDEKKARNIIKTSEYSFYPLIHMFSAIISLQCVKCTGKYQPINSPFVFDCYEKVFFEKKTKIQGQMLNLIDTDTLQKLAHLQVGIVDNGWQSLQLLNLLYSCSISQQTRVILCGLESITQSEQKINNDGLILKAHLKYQILNELFKNKKTQTIPCSLSFSNDLILNDMWKKIKLLINTSNQLNDYVYNNVIWNQIDIVDCSSHQLKGILKMCAATKSQLKQNYKYYTVELIDYRTCVQKSIEQFQLIFIDIFQDIRCFVSIGGSYLDRVKMKNIRSKIFLSIICCLQHGSYIDPENIVKICKQIFQIFFSCKLDNKDQLIIDFLKSLYFLLAWFFTNKQLNQNQINNYFNQYLKINDNNNNIQQISEQNKYQIAYSKLAIVNKLTIPYWSLNQLYRKQYTVKFIWNSSQIYSRFLKIQQQVNSKKFYKYYYRRLKPCPFISQIINSMIPITVLESVNNNLNTYKLDLTLGTITSEEAPAPISIKTDCETLIPQNCNQWTVIIIDGPKRISQIIERFKYMENVTIQKIKCENEVLYNISFNKNIYIDLTIQAIPTLSQTRQKGRLSYELHIEAIDNKEKPCHISRVKYMISQ